MLDHFSYDGARAKKALYYELFKGANNRKVAASLRGQAPEESITPSEGGGLVRRGRAKHVGTGLARSTVLPPMR